MTYPTPPPRGLVTLVGPAGAGKSSWAARHYPEAAVLSLDQYRLAATDDASDQSGTPVAVQVRALLLDARLARQLTTVADSTSCEQRVREQLLAAARRWQMPATAVLFTTPLGECLRRNAARSRVVPSRVIRAQHAARPDVEQLRAEGWDVVLTVGAPETADAR